MRGCVCVKRVIGTIIALTSIHHKNQRHARPRAIRIPSLIGQPSPFIPLRGTRPSSPEQTVNLRSYPQTAPPRSSLHRKPTSIRRRVCTLPFGSKYENLTPAQVRSCPDLFEVWKDFPPGFPVSQDRGTERQASGLRFCAVCK